MERATKLLWLDYWASRVDPNYKYAVIQEEKQKDGSWLVEAKLPFYDKTISRTSNNLMEAVLPVADEACEVIEQLMNDNPLLRVENKYIDGHWKIVVDKDDGRYLIMQSDEYFKETQETHKYLSETLYNSSTALLHTIEHCLKTTKPIYLHIFDKSLFGIENKEIMKNVEKLITKLHKNEHKPSRIFISGDSVVAYGFEIEIR